jgi:hypothetical protein
VCETAYLTITSMELYLRLSNGAWLVVIGSFEGHKERFVEGTIVAYVVAIDSKKLLFDLKLFC